MYLIIVMTSLAGTGMPDDGFFPRFAKDYPCEATDITGYQGKPEPDLVLWQAKVTQQQLADLEADPNYWVEYAEEITEEILP